MKPQVIVIGQGPAGLLSASLLTGSAEVTLVAEAAGSLTLWSGTFDFASRDASGQFVTDPRPVWDGIPPGHPAGTLSPAEWHTVWRLFGRLWERVGIPLSMDPVHNRWVVTASGVPRPSFAVPPWIWATPAPVPLTFVDVPGLLDYPAEYLAANYGFATGKTANVLKLPSPPRTLDTPLRWAYWLDTAEGEAWLLEHVPMPPALEGPVIFPGVLGVRRTMELTEHVARRLGREVGEMTAVPPAVSGLRLNQAWQRWLRAAGVKSISGTVIDMSERTLLLRDGRHFTFDAAILATGGILGGGLERRPDGSLHDTARGQEIPERGQANLFSMGLMPVDASGRLADRVWVAGRQWGGTDPDRALNGGALILGTSWLACQGVLDTLGTDERAERRLWP